MLSRLDTFVIVFTLNIWKEVSEETVYRRWNWSGSVLFAIEPWTNLSMNNISNLGLQEFCFILSMVNVQKFKCLVLFFFLPNFCILFAASVTQLDVRQTGDQEVGNILSWRSWNIFYGHSLSSADSRRAVVSFWWKNVHNSG